MQCTIRMQQFNIPKASFQIISIYRITTTKYKNSLWIIISIFLTDHKFKIKKLVSPLNKKEKVKKYQKTEKNMVSTN